MADEPSPPADGPFRKVERLVFLDDDVAPELTAPLPPRRGPAHELPRAVRFQPASRAAPWQPHVPASAAQTPAPQRVAHGVAANLHLALLCLLAVGIVSGALVLLSLFAHHASVGPTTPQPRHTHHGRHH